MDPENLSNIGTIIKYIKSQYEHVIIISHLEQLKNQAYHSININQHNGYSYVDDAYKLAVQSSMRTIKETTKIYDIIDKKNW